MAYLNQINSNQMMLPLRAVDIVRMSRFASIGFFRRASKDDERIVRESMERMEVNSLANEPLSALSGGQRQRVFIAQALAHDARLLLLDEPETNLDAEGKEKYRSAVRASTVQGGVVVIATHDIKEASRCDWAMLLAKKVVAFGPGCSVLTPETLLSAFGITVRMEEGKVVVVEREHGHECGE
jgi:ABC-type Mn2+/Zn2+ transport system ATPase subunit